MRISVPRMVYDRIMTARGLGGGGVEPYSPLTLFAASESGAWYDPSDLSTMFQDSAGTIPVTTHGDPVGRILDKSGNGAHAVQATAAARPVYQTDGTLRWLQFDGTDDTLRTAIGAVALTQEFHVSLGLQIPSTLTSKQHVSGTGGAQGYVSHDGSRRFTNYAGTFLTTTGTVPADVGVVSHNIFNGASSQIYHNNTLLITGNAGTAGWTGVYLGGYFTNLINGRIYGVVARKGAMTETQRTALTTYLAGKSGVTL